MDGGSLNTCCGRRWCEHCQKGSFVPSIWMPTVQQCPLTSCGRKLDHSTPFGKIDVEHHLQELLLFLFISFNTGGIFVNNVRKFSEDRHRNFITLSYRTTCWLKIRILDAVPVLSVDPCHINSAEVAVSDMVCRLPPNHGNSKIQTPLATGPPTQSLRAFLANHVWRPSFILVRKLNSKISMVSTRYETCDWLSIRSNGVFLTYVAEHVGLISARSSGWTHLIHLQNKNRYKLVINWCHRSKLRSLFGATITTTQNIPQHTWSENTRTCVGQVFYTLPGAAAPLNSVLMHQIYALPHQGLEDFEVLWLQNDSFST